VGVVIVFSGAHVGSGGFAPGFHRELHFWRRIVDGYSKHRAKNNLECCEVSWKRLSKRLVWLRRL
jgi:hypothetical protein